MSRALCVVAALAILATGCASRGRVARLELEVARLRPAPAVGTPAPRARPRAAQTPPALAPEQVYNTALQTFRSREHGQAVLDFLDFIAKYPRRPLAANAQYWIGEAYYAQRDYRQALVEFQKVFEYGPAKAPDALVKMGLCWVKLRAVRRAQG